MDGVVCGLFYTHYEGDESNEGVFYIAGLKLMLMKEA